MDLLYTFTHLQRYGRPIHSHIHFQSNSLSANLTLHPLQLFGQEHQLDWVIFHDVLATSRVFLRTVCPIRYDWVKDLLPKLHEVDVYELSSVAREEVTDEEVAKWESKEAMKRQAGKQFTRAFAQYASLCSMYLSCPYNIFTLRFQ